MVEVLVGLAGRLQMWRDNRELNFDEAA